MNFFIDALPYSTKDILQEFGNVWHARDVKLQDAENGIIFNFAKKKKAILVTKDLEFANPYLYPKDSHCGLLILRVPFYFTAKQINAVLKKALLAIEIHQLRNSTTIIEPGKIRIRKNEK